MPATTKQRSDSVIPPILAPFPYLLGTAYLDSLKANGGQRNLIPPFEVVSNDVLTMVQKSMEFGAAWVNLWTHLLSGIPAEEA